MARSPELWGRTTGGRPNPFENTKITIKNDESSATITAGQPVCFVYDGTDNGLAVVLPSSGAAIKAHTLFAGIAIDTIAAGQYGESILSGHCRAIRVLRQTRAASTDAWASTPAFAVGDYLAVDTVNNAMNRIGSLAVSAFIPIAVVGETLASATTLASTSFTTGDTRTAITAEIQGLVRAM